MKRRLFEHAAEERAKTGKALVLVDRDGECPVCAAPLLTDEAGERALFRHGGYGAERKTVRVHCSECSWSLIPEVSEVKPS